MTFFRRRKGDVAPPARHVLVHLNARVQPVHRGEIYEDPLDEVLARLAPGSVVTGGGSTFSRETGVESCDIELDLVGDPEVVVPQVVSALESFGAPRGSWLTVDDGDELAFGLTHGIALGLDGRSLPAEVYAGNDVNVLIDSLIQDLEGIAVLQSWWEGPERTFLYFYGPDPGRLREVLEGASERFPLAERSLVTSITP